MKNSSVICNVKLITICAMKHKLLALLSLGIISLSLSAKPANVVYYIMSQTTDSVYDDSILAVEFDISCPLIHIPDAGYLHPQPQISLIVTNKTDKTVRLNLGQSTFTRNLYIQTFNDISSQPDITIAPHASISFDNIKLLPQEAQEAFNNIYHYRHLKVLNNDYGWLCFGHIDKSFEPGNTISYTQNDTPIFIATSLVYSVADEDDRYEIRTEYFAEKKIGSALNGIATEKEEIINNTYPDWVNPKHEIIKLWCVKEK